MTVTDNQPLAQPPANNGSGRHRRILWPANRIRRDGKFFRLGDEKFFVKGVTYGPFAPDENGLLLPSPQQIRRDFELMRELGVNCIRIYHTPPVWFLDMAQQSGIKIFLDVAWPKNLLFIDQPDIAQQAHDAVAAAARSCGNHPAMFAISVANEIPPDIVRYAGRKQIEAFIDELVLTVKSHAPQCLVTFANFPTTEYLAPQLIDFVCFNVYLHEPATFRRYLARLQTLAGEKPLMLGEYGIDTFREYSEEKQAEILGEHVRAVFDEGLVGTFIFSFTDDWFVHGHPIEDWAFGIVRKDRTIKPAFTALKPLFAKAPQLTDLPLASISVVICSYNGASTVETCLQSMRRIRYPDFEVVFVDDGSKDHTQQILEKFPEVRNIRQVNKGLSIARNVGAQAARGEIVIYTDSDCEADEDWLYYIALAMARSDHKGMGGPNLIPDEESWVADCVGLSPGGPTHVMIDDRTAEHVPGCNMAFYKSVLQQVNGFDSQFRKAGDDVDVIWRIQQLGYTIGYSPAAQVWHYRRNTIKAYLSQQRGYGEAEALLKYKHPDHFNTLGASHWRGRIYGGEQIGVRLGGDVVYHGFFGTGLFQTIYRKPASMVAAMMMSIEWHLLAGFVAILALVLTPLAWVALGMFATPVILALIAAWQAPAPKHHHPLSRLLIAYLHLRQPITRGWARYAVRLKNKVMKPRAMQYDWSGPLPLDRYEKRTLRYWSKDYERLHLLEQLKDEIQNQGLRSRIDSGWEPWDMEVYASRYVKVRLTTTTETHHGKGMLTRVRVRLIMTKFCQVLLAATIILASLLMVHIPWTFSRTAFLIPLVWWSMYLMNKWRILGPMLGMVDHVAADAGFYPVATQQPPAQKQ